MSRPCQRRVGLAPDLSLFTATWYLTAAIWIEASILHAETSISKQHDANGATDGAVQLPPAPTPATERPGRRLHLASRLYYPEFAHHSQLRPLIILAPWHREYIAKDGQRLTMPGVPDCSVLGSAAHTSVGLGL